MIIEVKVFAVAKQLVGAEVVKIELPSQSTVGQLRQALADQYPELGETLRHVVFAVNQEYASNETSIPLHAEVACIPPVSGGT